jgi:hypothetical protein
MVANSLKAKKIKSGVPKEGWLKPPIGLLKLNTDAAVELEARKASTGCVIRDSNGQFMGAYRQEVVGVIDVTTIEAQALRDGLQLAEHIGCNKIHVKSDCMEVVQALADPRNNRIMGSAYLDECLMIFAGFNMTRIAHCPKKWG